MINRSCLESAGRWSSWPLRTDFPIARKLLLVMSEHAFARYGEPHPIRCGGKHFVGKKLEIISALFKAGPAAFIVAAPSRYCGSLYKYTHGPVAIGHGKVDARHGFIDGPVDMHEALAHCLKIAVTAHDSTVRSTSICQTVARNIIRSNSWKVKPGTFNIGVRINCLADQTHSRLKQKIPRSTEASGVKSWEESTQGPYGMAPLLVHPLSFRDER